MKNCLFICIILLNLFGCSEAKMEEPKTTETYIEMDTLFTSRGVLSFTTFTVSDSESVKQYFYYDSGNLKHYWRLRNNKQHGTDFWNYENGQIRQQSQWKNGFKIGQEYQYYQNRKIHKILDWESNTTLEYFLTSPQIKFFSSDSINALFYLDGALREKHITSIAGDSSFFYHENGELSFKGLKRDGKLLANNQPYTGDILCYFSNGDTALFDQYISGFLEGKSFRKYKPTVYEQIHFYEQSEPIRYRKIFYDNGQVLFEHYIQNDSLRAWNEDGTKMSR